jgi:hypothetical protein
MTNLNTNINLNSDLSDNLICSICQDKLDEKIIFLECSHMFHHECIMNWYNNTTDKKSCPLCRKDIIIDIELTPLLNSNDQTLIQSKYKYIGCISILFMLLGIVLLTNTQIKYI